MATIWKDIMQIEPRQPQMHSNYLENVGNWDKSWQWPFSLILERCMANRLSKPSLATTFPALFRIISNTEELLSEVSSKKGIHSTMGISVQKEVIQNWEKESLDELKELFFIFIFLISELKELLDTYLSRLTMKEALTFYFGRGIVQTNSPSNPCMSCPDLNLMVAVLKQFMDLSGTM